MVQWVEELPCKHEDLNLFLSLYTKMSTCNPRTREAETGVLLEHFGQPAEQVLLMS